MVRILVIKLGALGDFIQAFAGFQQIRRAHPDAEITLLTTPPFAELARASGLFDVIETDGRPDGAWKTLAMLARLRGRRYARIYDLQTSGRSSRYFYAFLPFPPQWSGIAFGASHRQTRPDRTRLHNLDRIADQIHVTGAGPAYALGEAPAPDLSWAAATGAANATLQRFGLARPYALLAPGASPGKLLKLWPTERYADLARRLRDRGLQIGVVGGPAEAEMFEIIAREVADAVDLTGKTSLVDLAALGAQAELCVGNDTGPTHLIAYAGAPGVMVMSYVSDPRQYAPRARMQVLRVPDLADLTVETVMAQLFAAED